LTLDALGHHLVEGQDSVQVQDVRNQVVGEQGKALQAAEAPDREFQVGRSDLGPLVDGHREAAIRMYVIEEGHLRQQPSQRFGLESARLQEGLVAAAMVLEEMAAE